MWFRHVINRDGRGCLLLQILLPCRIMTLARTRLCQSVLDCVPYSWWELCSWIIWKTISSWQQISIPFCVIWVMEMFSRNEKCSLSNNSEQVFWLEVHQWHQTASFRIHLILGVEGEREVVYAWCVSLFMHPWLSPSLSSVPAVKTYL